MLSRFENFEAKDFRSHPNELAVVVQTDGADLIVYNLAGRWSRWERFQNRDIQFHLPQFIGQDFVDAVLPFVSETIDKDGVSEPPPGFLEGAVPRHLGGPALDKLHAHNREVQMFHASHAKKLDYVWELLAQDDKRVNLSMSDASIMLFNQPSSDLTAPALHALNQALYDDYMNIATNVGGRTTGKTFSLRSKHESEMQQRVLKWARNYQDAAAKAARGWAVQHTLKENPLNKFILKARRAILKSRSYRSPTVMGTAGPSAPMVADPTKITVEDDANFSDADRDIIKFVMNAHGTVPSRSLLVKSTASMILRAIGAYPNMPLGVPTGRLLLQEIGVHAPWDYLRLHDPMLKVPGNGSLPSLDLTLAKTRKLAMDDPHECNKDMNAGFRKDWVDMVAFRVDALSTKDHDDAFSLEQEPGRENAWWIHVHIADPAAFIPPDHPFAKYAAEVRATTYLVEQTSGMLPPELIARLAVASNRPVLTFSSLVQSDGETLDFKITPGTVRNIISCTPGTLSRFLFGQRPEPIRFSVRSNNANAVAPREGGARHLEPHRQTLRKLAELAKAMQRRREAKWRPRTWEGGRYACQAYISPIPRTKVDRDPTHSRIFQGDPSISLEMMPANHPDHDLDIVGEIMTGANIAVARWCRERGVSIPYLATEYHPNFPRERLRSLQRHEYTVFPATKKTTEPRPHDLVPADQYTQATSPLRRFHDLSVHWQIRGVLKHEHKHGRSLRYTENLQSALPFSKTDIERSIDEYEFFEKLKARMGNKNINHWAIQALFRAVHFKEGQLPDITYLRVQNKTKSDAINGVGWIGNLAPFDVQAVLGTSTEGFEKGVEAHDVIPCKISRVETAMQICLVVAVGPALNSNVFDDISVMNPLKFTQEEYNRLLLGYGKGQS